MQARRKLEFSHGDAYGTSEVMKVRALIVLMFFFVRGVRYGGIARRFHGGTASLAAE
jgi:hypothetical protein